MLRRACTALRQMFQQETMHMQTLAQATVPSRDSARTRIDLKRVMRYENPAVVKKIEQTYGLSHADARILFDDTKMFLYLCATNPSTKLGPTIPIDDGWHTFILFTEDYATFCREQFGTFIHHQPHVEHGVADPSKLPPKVKVVVDLAHKVFGGQLSKNWDVQGLELADGNCTPSTNCQSSTCW